MHVILNAIHYRALQAHIQQLTLAVRQAAEKSTPDEYRDR